MKSIIISLLLFTFLFISLQSCKKDEIEINNTTEFEVYIQSVMDIQKIPAISILIFEEKDVKYERYFGKSNLQQNTTLKFDDIFLLASISKVVTATALLQLHEDGLFALDDKINDYLPLTSLFQTKAQR